MVSVVKAVDRGTKTERLPFTVQMASRQDLQRVARLRAATYGKHLPDLGVKLQEPEAADFERGCVVFVATSKLDGSTLGTVRVHTNMAKPLPLQASMRLPSRFRGTRMIESTRLSILGSSGSSVVRIALIKAVLQYCEMQQVDWMMVAGRQPVDRMYDGLLCTDVEEYKKFYPMAHAGGIPHRVMSFPTMRARALWADAKHPMYEFMFETEHPDIDLSGIPMLDFEWDSPEEMPAATPLPIRSFVPAFASRWPSFAMGMAA